MKKQTIPVTIPAGFEFEAFDSQSNTVIVKELPKNASRINSIEAALSELGEQDPEVIIYQKLAAVFEADNHILNYQTAVVLIKAINDGWEPNWDDSNEPKYVLWWYMGGSAGFRYDDCDYWDSYSAVGSRLCFKKWEDGQYLAKTFPAVFKNFMLKK